MRKSHSKLTTAHGCHQWWLRLSETSELGLSPTQRELLMVLLPFPAAVSSCHKQRPSLTPNASVEWLNLWAILSGTLTHPPYNYMISINKKFEANASGLVGVELVEDFRHIEIMLRAHTTPDFTVKVKGSLSEYLPDFTATQSAENNWDALQCKDLEDASTIDGDTGFVFDSLSLIHI